MDNFKSNLSAEIITKAVAGDDDAIAEVLKAYEPYIIEQSKVKCQNKDGSVTETVDEDLAQTLRLTLVEQIPNFKMGDE